MKKYLLIFIFLAASACGQISDVTDYIMFFGTVPDSSGWTNYKPDSVHITGFHNGVECHDAWYNLADAQADSLNGGLIFFDQIQDLDNDAGNGYYLFVADFFYDADSLYQKQTLQKYVINGVSSLLDWTPRLDNDSLIIDQSTLTALKSTVVGRTIDVTATGTVGVDFGNVEGDLDSNETSIPILTWVPKLDNDSLIIDQSTLTALKPTIPGRTVDVASTGEVGVDFSNINGTLDASEIGTNALDSTKINANLVIKLNDSLLTVLNELKKVDTVLWLLGLQHTARSITKYYNDVDTVFIRAGSDTLKYVVYYHTGGTPGAAPDSTRCYNY